jgi:Transglutaminase-like superfamily
MNRVNRTVRISFAISIFALVVAFWCVSTPRLSADPWQRARSQRRSAQSLPSGTVEDWQVIYLGKSRIGYSRNLTRPVAVEGKQMLKTESEMHLTLKRFGQTMQLETRQDTEELPDGELRSFVFEIKNPPAAPTRASGHVQDNRLVGETNVGGTVRDFSTLWDASTRSPAYLDRITREHRFRPGETLSLKAFMPEEMQTSDIRVMAGRMERVSLLDGRRPMLLKLTVLESVAPQTPTQIYVDDRGESLVSTTEMLGQTLTSYTVSAEEALKQVAGPELDIAVNTLVRSNVIPQGNRAKHVVYRIKIPGEDPTPFIPNYPYQKVIRTGPDECRVTVDAVVPTSTNRSRRVDPQYLSNSRYLQTSDPAVIAHAERAAASYVIDPVQIAVAMEKYVNQQLQKKDFSTALASAAEVAKSLQGDCTEHAVLLAAMLRVRNVPSRIAVGLVYIEPLACFGGHMWTEAFLGDRWVPLDATLGYGVAGAARIKLADSSFDDNGPAPMTAFLPLLHVLGRIELTMVESSPH